MTLSTAPPLMSTEPSSVLFEIHHSLLGFDAVQYEVGGGAPG